MDSAGARPFQVASQPVLQVGVVEGDPMQELDRVVDPFLLPNGFLAVPTEGARSVRIFDGSGGFVESLGGPGEGPGEFASLRDAWNRADTVEVWDSRARRITRFVPGGQVEVVDFRGVSLPLDAAAGALGDVWVIESIALGDPRDRMAAQAFGRDGEYRGALVETEGMARYGSASGSGPHPLSPTAVFRVHGGWLYVAETLTPIIHVFDAGGTLVEDIPLDLVPPGPAELLLEQVVDSAVARAEDDGKAGLRRWLGGFPSVDEISSFWDFIVDEVGLIWVRPYEPLRHSLALDGRPGGRPGPGGEWVVFSPDGRELGRVDMPSGLEPVQITRDAVVGIHRDDLGVESVQVYPLTRSVAG